MIGQTLENRDRCADSSRQVTGRWLPCLECEKRPIPCQASDPIHRVHHLITGTPVIASLIPQTTLLGATQEVALLAALGRDAGEKLGPACIILVGHAVLDGPSQHRLTRVAQALGDTATGELAVGRNR